jgi:hypothetical protein
LGILLIWLLRPERGSVTSRTSLNSAPFWLSSLLFGYIFSGLVLWIVSNVPATSDQAGTDWRLIMAAGFLGSAPGVLTGWLLSWQFSKLLARPSVLDMMPQLMESDFQEYIPDGRVATEAEKRLSTQMVAAARKQNVKCYMQKLDNWYVMQFSWNNPSNKQVVCYIICTENYPMELPQDVKLEVVNSVGQSEERMFDTRNLLRMPREEILFHIINDSKQIAA